jgi:hypothetical protein
MYIDDIIIEATYGPDTRYTAQDLDMLFKTMEEIVKFAATELGIQLTVTSHFKDQLSMKRNPGEPLFGKITRDELITTMAQILSRGLRFFKHKDDGTNYVFFYPQTLLNIPLVKKADNRFAIPTVVKSSRYLGRDQKITL